MRRRLRTRRPDERVAKASPKPRAKSADIPSRWYRPEPYTDAELADVAAGTRLRAPVLFFAGFEVYVRPLTESELGEACRQARARVQLMLANEGIPDDDTPITRGLQSRIIERCIILRATMQPGVSADDASPFFAALADVEALDASTVSTLFATFVEVQQRSSPVSSEADAKALAEAIAERRNGLEHVRARFATELCSYYGVRSVREITDLQIIRYVKLIEVTR